MSVALVLGAGGAMAASYHAGVLAALEHDLDWDPRDADVVVGTSAGALVAAVLRRGARAADLSAITHGNPALDTDTTLAERLAQRPSFTSPSLRRLLGVPRLMTPALAAGLVAAGVNRRVDALPALLLLLPDGREDLLPHLGFLAPTEAAPWPEATTLVCAARHRDGRRAVFGQGGRTAPLDVAVAASCAVPGYFRPVVVEGERFVDGGVVSATNADILLRRRGELDLVVVVSPLTGDDHGRSAANQVRRYLRRRLDREVSRLRAAGLDVVVLEPGREVLPLMTLDFVDDSTADEIAREAFLDAGLQIAAERRLDELRSARRTAPRRRRRLTVLAESS